MKCSSANGLLDLCWNDITQLKGLGIQKDGDSEGGKFMGDGGSEGVFDINTAMVDENIERSRRTEKRSGRRRKQQMRAQSRQKYL
ncbi:hypothetical protein SUGI_0136460 [Cryptomeria japonica]|nr:hypothetical protein SUGI_0136460 [Cryptomeria japonica]